MQGTAWAQIYFGIRRDWIIITVGIAAVLLFCIAWENPAWQESMESWWINRLDPVIGIGTLIVAIIVWLGEIRDDWRNSLPKRLTVVFRYKGKPVMCCELAHLFSDADIRQLGQQIGVQMAGEEVKFLDFIASDIRRSERPEIIKIEGCFMIHHKIEYDLIKLPRGGELKENDCRLWKPPFSDKTGKETWCWQSEMQS